MLTLFPAPAGIARRGRLPAPPSLPHQAQPGLPAVAHHHLPPGVGLSVYRVCQESLTNVLKHAGPSASVTVLLRWDATQLTLDVTDDGRGAAAASDGAGHGLVGMRERATMFGGSLSAGPRPGGGFRVHLELPVPPVTVRPGAAPAYPDAAGVPNPGSTP